MKSIETEEEYNQSIKRLDEIFDSKNNTPEGDELDELISAISEYEDKHYPFEKESFFSPVQGGQNNGYTFLQFISSPQRWGTLLTTLLFIAWVLNVGQKESLEIIAIPLAFLSAIFFTLIFLHLRKWNDLKNHRSR